MIGDFMQPTIILDQTTFDELINTLEPWLIDQNQRRALLWSAFHNDSSLYRQIDFTGAAHPFTVNLVNTLLTYGEIRSGQHALIALLNAIQQQVGVNKQQRIKRLQALLAPQLKTRLLIAPPAPQRSLRASLRYLQWAAILGAIGLLSFIVLGVNRDGLSLAAATPAPTVIITLAAQPTIAATALVTETILPIPPPPSLQDRVMADMQRSTVPMPYPQAANQFVETLFIHLDDFQLPTLGITKQTVMAALEQADVGDRINGIVQAVWGEWVGLANHGGFDIYTTEPTVADHHLTPFRQLVIRMCQGRQGQLVDSQQHALHSLLTRREEPTVWQTDLNDVIGAINRDSFQWP